MNGFTGSVDNYELGDVITSNIEYYLRHSFNTGIPAQVTDVSKYESSQVVSVIPIMNKLYKDGTILEYPEVFDAPVIVYGAGRGALSFPVAVNDVVWLEFSQVSLDRFLKGGGSESKGLDKQTFTPDERSFNQLKDAVVVLGINTEDSHVKPHPTDVELKFGGSYVRMSPDGDVTIKAARDVTIEAERNAKLTAKGIIDIESVTIINIKAPTINITGNVTMGGL